MKKGAPVVNPSLDDFEKAREVISQIAIESPIIRNSFLSDLTGQEVYLKCENMQRTGAYKVRGALNRLSKLTEAERERGVVAASAGNHAQGVALAAKRLGIKATIFMPIGASIPKHEATLNYGADVVLTGNIFDETLATALRFTKESKAVFIPPFDDIDIITGQGTVAMEIAEQYPEFENVIACVGGGGLIAGVASATKQIASKQGRTISVYGVQAEMAAAYPESLKQGKPVEVKVRPTIADGIAVAKPGEIPFGIIQENVDEIVTVTEDEIAQAMVMLLERAKQVVEPGGVVGVAALMAGKIKPTGPTVVTLSGGNIDPLLLQRVIRHGLAASDRYTNVSVMLPDRPGQLVRTAEAVADAGANVVEVLHTRHGNGLQISEVELNLSVETRNREHRDHLIESLKKAGLNPSLHED